MPSKESMKDRLEQNKTRKTAATDFIEEMEDKSIETAPVIKADPQDSVVISKRSKYEDAHVRKTYYVHKENIKKIGALRKKTNFSQSEIINRALEEFFKRVEIK